MTIQLLASATLRVIQESVRFARNFLIDGVPACKAACFLKGLGYRAQSGRNRPHAHHATGFTEDEIIDPCALAYANEENCEIDPWPPSLGLYKSMVIALACMRRNRVQQEIAETYQHFPVKRQPC